MITINQTKMKEKRRKKKQEMPILTTPTPSPHTQKERVGVVSPHLTYNMDYSEYLQTKVKYLLDHMTE